MQTVAPTTGVIVQEFAEFGRVVLEALRAREVDDVVAITAFDPIDCDSGGIILPPGCTELSGSSAPVVRVGVLQSEGMYVDEAGYRALLNEFVTNLADSPDEWGDPSPAIHSAGLIDAPVGEAGSTYLLVTRISGPRPQESPVVPGLENSRQALFFGITSAAEDMAVNSLIFAPLNLVEPETSGSLESLASGLYSEWERWPED